MDGDPHALDVGFTGERLPESTHVCLIFDDEQQRLDIVSEYLATGLRQHEVVRWFHHVSTPEMVRSSLAAKGVDVAAAERGPLSVVPATRAYCPNGTFDPPAMIASMKAGYVKAEAAGYRGTRSTGEMTWSLEGLPGSERLLEYEALIGTIDTPFPHTGMCQYDARRFDGATLFKVLQLHPFMVAQGQIVRNPYYVRPGEFAGRP